MTADTGLLSPVRVGTPVEKAVEDRAWLQAMLDAEAALVRAQARLGTVPGSAAKVISETADADLFDIRELAVACRETANPVVGVVGALTRAVAGRAPDAAEYVHRGSTSQDIFDTGAMLVCDRAIRLILTDLDRTARALEGLARDHRDTPIVGRTLALHAVPTTFGVKAAGWRQLVLDAIDRLGSVVLPVSLGGAAGTLGGYLEYASPADPGDYVDRLVEAFAEETGLVRSVLPWHAVRTPMADVASTLSFTATALGKIAVDVQVLARTEIAEVAEPAVAGRGGSSAMPHKRNPVLATLMRTAAMQVPALASILHQCVTSEDERSAGGWHAEWLPLRESLRLVGGAAHTAAELVEGLDVRSDRMRDNLALTGGQVVTERIAAVLAPRLGKAAAKELLNRLSVTSQEEGRPLSELLREADELSGVLTAAEISDLVDPTAYTGAAGLLVDRALR